METIWGQRLYHKPHIKAVLGTKTGPSSSSPLKSSRATNKACCIAQRVNQTTKRTWKVALQEPHGYRHTQIGHAVLPKELLKRQHYDQLWIHS